MCRHPLGIQPDAVAHPTIVILLGGIEGSHIQFSNTRKRTVVCAEQSFEPVVATYQSQPHGGIAVTFHLTRVVEIAEPHLTRAIHGHHQLHRLALIAISDVQSGLLRGCNPRRIHSSQHIVIMSALLLENARLPQRAHQCEASRPVGQTVFLAIGRILKEPIGLERRRGEVVRAWQCPPHSLPPWQCRCHQRGRSRCRGLWHAVGIPVHLEQQTLSAQSPPIVGERVFIAVGQAPPSTIVQPEGLRDVVGRPESGLVIGHRREKFTQFLPLSRVGTQVLRAQNPLSAGHITGHEIVIPSVALAHHRPLGPTVFAVVVDPREVYGLPYEMPIAPHLLYLVDILTVLGEHIGCAVIVYKDGIVIAHGPRRGRGAHLDRCAPRSVW